MEALLIVALWSGPVPHAVGTSPADQPSMSVHLPAKEKATGAACVICPGGGYGFLASEHEGTDAAAFLNKHGIAAFVLKYRVVAKDRPAPLHPAPLADAQRAIRTVRANAEKYGVDAKRIGIWGFSAGGHLASTAGTHFDDGKPDGDAVDKVSSRPDFLVLSYPVVSTDPTVAHGGSVKNLLGPTPSEELLKFYSNDLQVTAKTPPTFIFHTDEDTGVVPENAIRFYQACKKNKVPCELHIYAKGAHGLGLGTGMRNEKDRTKFRIPPEPAVASWPPLLIDWMTTRGVIGMKK